MNTIPTTNWIGCLIFSTLFLSLWAAQPGSATAQYAGAFSYERALRPDVSYNRPDWSIYADTTDRASSRRRSYPDPKSVLYKSLIIPGWGQIVNKQAWKVPIVYGLLGGLTYYSIYLTQKYHDYRAAYYNLQYGADGGYKFGQTPAYLSGNVSGQALQYNRNYFRNRRDFIYITIALAYGLNAIDAYVFAHLRSFNVSDDLSMRTSFKPTVVGGRTPGMAIRIDLWNRSSD